MKNKPAALVILTPGFPKDETDSTCLPMQQQFLLSIKKKYPLLHIVVLSFQYPYQPCTYYWNNIPVKSFGGKNKGSWKRWLLWQRIKGELELLHTNYTITGIISFWLGECALLANRFAAQHRVKHYCWLLGQDAKKGNRYVKRITPVAEELVALSDFIADTFTENYGIRPAHVITPGIDTSLFPPTFPEKTIDIIGVGSLIPLKQFDLLPDIIFSINKQLPGIRALICGEGPERKRIEEKIISLGLTNNIQLTGELPHPEILRLLQQSKILLHPSTYEGFGVVMLEALYAGAKVISFVKPQKQTINNWQIVYNAEEMAAKAITLLQEPSPNPARVFEFPIEKCADAFMALFDRASLLPVQSLDQSP